MRNAFILAAALSLSAAFAPSDARAFSVPPAGYQSDSIIRVEGGCGPGFHRNPYGYCRPNGPGPGWVAPGPAVVPVPVPVPGYGYGAYYGRRCWVRQTYYGPRRVCNY